MSPDEPKPFPTLAEIVQGSAVRPAQADTPHLPDLGQLKPSEYRFFHSVEPPAPETEYRRPAHPSIDATRAITFGAEETPIAEAVFSQAIQKHRAEMPEPATWNRLEIASKANVTATVTDRRLVISVPDEATIAHDVTGVQQQPKRWHGVAMRAIGRVIKDLAPGLTAGHFPLEAISHLSHWRKGGIHWLSVMAVVSPSGSEYRTLEAVEVGAQDESVAQFAHAVANAIAQRWKEVDAADILVGKVSFTFAPSDAGRHECECSVFRPLGSTEVVLTAGVRAQHSDLPPRLELDGSTLVS